ncbi:tripartite ATP-independent transporter DctP family solute receptor [Alkalibacillus filiformis]|uniref:Tripartite ATP-independent transporter DctP family solute receptor n=1 Tax=Alkalibacillus filiformis TaxID=200990 RepID=A0ABU0DW75_9BACI|nr:TRAP transporter substrate-binding protein DctP [Alkalibacillus filiformis]MDQ0352584.1 tripartite ATP-independent transporter DctP family solute receptor [Alkalibacillus filiformis]
MIIFNLKNVGLALAMVLTLGFLAACGGDGDESQNWRFVTEEVEGQVQYVYAQEFADRMYDKTDGEVQIDVYEFGGLGEETDQVDQLMQGAVEMAVMSPGFTGDMVSEGQLFALHFLFPDDVATTQDILTNSEALNTDLRERYEEHNISPLAYWTEGAMQWTSNDHPLTSPEDFENFQMRIQMSPLIRASYEAYGADPQDMSWGELYTALDRGTVQGQENPIFFIGDASFHEVQDYMTMSNHNNYVAMTTVNTEWYNELDDDIRALVDETTQEMQSWIFEEQQRQNEEFITIIEEDTDNPTEIVELTEEERQVFRDIATDVREFYRSEVSGVGGEILDKLEEEIAEHE